MIDQTRAEILKVRSTRTTLGLVLGMVALLLLIVLLTSLLADAGDLSGVSNQRDLLGLGTVACWFSALSGLLLVTSEYRFGTIRPTTLVAPRRSRIMLGKLAAGLLSGLALAVVAQLLAFGITSLILAGRDISIALDGGEIAQLLLGTLFATALWGAIGVGVGAIVRNQVGGVIGLLAFVFVLEPILFGLVPSVGRLMPSRAQDALIGQVDSHFVSPAAGGALLVAWAVVLALAGTALVARRDVD